MDGGLEWSSVHVERVISSPRPGITQLGSKIEHLEDGKGEGDNAHEKNNTNRNSL